MQPEKVVIARVSAVVAAVVATIVASSIDGSLVLCFNSKLLGDTMAAAWVQNIA
jgi:hypothetical protein